MPGRGRDPAWPSEWVASGPPTAQGATPTVPLTIAPSYTGAKSQEFVDVSLSQYKGQYVVLFFYPLDFTFV